MIRSSLAALGKSRESDNVRALFSCFALVPEDTIAPLGILAIMFDAVNRADSAGSTNDANAKIPDWATPGFGKSVVGQNKSTSSGTTSLLLIRKWLKILIDRSLVLGTVDRPQLHDLVKTLLVKLSSPVVSIALLSHLVAVLTGIGLCRFTTY